MRIFYDTCALLNKLHHAFGKEQFYISSITLKELEGIKTSNSKEPDVKFRARRLIQLLDKHENDYIVIHYDANKMDFIFDNNIILDKNSNDSKIIATAIYLNQQEPILFITEDLCCKRLAKESGLNVQYLRVEKEDYCGFKVLSFSTDEELAEFYNYYTKKDYDLLLNEYLIIQNQNEIVDQYKLTENGLEQIKFTVFDSRMFGKIKPKDTYQLLAMDSLKSNKISMIRGSAGTGKSYLSFAFLFHKLEKGDIDKIIIFCNTVATSGSAKLGYYPGSKDEKLLDSQIGNLLASKLGDKFEVEKLIHEGKIILLPMSDIRGYDTTGMKAGIYISEAQNLDIELMKLALSRIGEDSICILDGDSETQVDLPLYGGNNNGMRRVSEVFRGHTCYGEVTLQNIHRSQIARLAQLM